jgi:hypothetical protein
VQIRTKESVAKEVKARFDDRGSDPRHFAWIA